MRDSSAFSCSVHLVAYGTSPVLCPLQATSKSGFFDRGMSGFHIQITHLNLAAQWMFTNVHPLRWKVKGFDQDREIDATLWYFSHSYGK